MARTTDELLAQIERLLPAQYRPLRPHLGGLAAMYRCCEQLGDAFKLSATVAGAESIWLSLLAHGQGIDRATDETDASLRERVRSPEDKLTPISILAVVNALLAPYTAVEAQLFEHWNSAAWCDDDAYADQDVLYDQHNTFTLVLPCVGVFNTGDAFCDDDAYADDCYIGQGSGEHPVYAAIISAVNKCRAAGVRWWMVIEDPYPPLAEAISAIAPGARMIWVNDAGLEVNLAGELAVWRNQASTSFDLVGSVDTTVVAESDGTLAVFPYGTTLQTAENTTFDDATVLVVFVNQVTVAAGEVDVIDHEYTTGFYFGQLASTEPTDWGGGFIEPAPPYGQFVTTPSETRVAYAIRREGTVHDLIKNGVVAETKAGSAASTASSPIAIGSAIGGAFASYGWRPFAIVIWPRAVSDAELVAIQETLEARGLAV